MERFRDCCLILMDYITLIWNDTKPEFQNFISRINKFEFEIWKKEINFQDKTILTYFTNVPFLYPL